MPLSKTTPTSVENNELPPTKTFSYKESLAFVYFGQSVVNNKHKAISTEELDTLIQYVYQKRWYNPDIQNLRQEIIDKYKMHKDPKDLNINEYIIKSITSEKNDSVFLITLRSPFTTHEFAIHASNETITTVLESINKHKMLTSKMYV